MRHLAVALATSLLVLAGCSDDDDDTAPTSTTSSTTTSSTTSTTELAEQPPPSPVADAVNLDLDVPGEVEAGPVEWRLEVTNTTDDEVVLTFPTSQRGDAVLLEGEVEVHRWSSGRFFTQAIEQQRLDAGETTTITLPDDLSGVEPGFYTLVAELTAVGPPEPVEQSIRVVSPD